MAIQVSGSTYVDPSGAVYYRYQSEQAPTGRYAEGSFLIQTKRGQVRYTQEQAQQEAARASARYLNIPLYEISGYEQTAPAGAIVGGTLAAQASREEAYQTQQAQLRAHREGLRQGFAGTFSEYGQRMASAPIGTPIPSQQQYAQVKYLSSPTAQWASPETFQAKAAQVERYAPFAGVTEFRGQIVQQAPPLQSFSGYQYESPFGKGLIKKENFPGALPQTPIGQERLTLMPLVSKASLISKSSQAFIESGIDVLPLPGIAKEFTKGASSVITGIPEFFATGAAGWETAIRKPQAFKSYAMPAIAEFGKQFVEQATTRPVYTVGQIAVMGAGARGIKLKTMSDFQAGIKQMAISEEARLFRKGEIDPWAKQPTMRESALKADKEWTVRETKAADILKPSTLGRGEVLTGKQGLIAVMEQQKPLTIKPQTAKYSRAGAIMEEPAAQYRTGMRSYIRPVGGVYKSPNLLKQRTESLQKMKIEAVQVPRMEVKTIASTKAMQIAGQRLRAVSLPVLKPLTKSVSITAQKQILSQISAQRVKILPVVKQITSQKAVSFTSAITTPTYIKIPKMKTPATRTPSIRSPRVFEPELPRIPKLPKSIPSFTGRRKGKKVRFGFGKFTEIGRIAAPSQIFKGFSFGPTKPRRKGKGKKR